MVDSTRCRKWLHLLASYEIRPTCHTSDVYVDLVTLVFHDQHNRNSDILRAEELHLDPVEVDA